MYVSLSIYMYICIYIHIYIYTYIYMYSYMYREREIDICVRVYVYVISCILIIRHAREMWWCDRQNTFGTIAVMTSLLARLPRGRDVQEVSCD